MDNAIEMVPLLPEDETSLLVFNTLSYKRQRFVENYCLLPSAVTAYQKVFPESSHESASANAYRLLKDKDIQAAILEVKQLNQTRFNIGKDYVVNELLKLVESKNHSTKLKALDLLTKVLGLNNHKVSVEGLEPVSIIMNMPQIMPQISGPEISEADIDEN